MTGAKGSAIITKNKSFEKSVHGGKVAVGKTAIKKAAVGNGAAFRFLEKHRGNRKRVSVFVDKNNTEA